MELLLETNFSSQTKRKRNSFLADTLESLGSAPGLWRASLPSLFTREDNEDASSV